MDAIVFIIFQIILAAYSVLKIGEYSPVLAREYIFGHVTCLDQSYTDKNISIDGLIVLVLS